MHWYENQSPSIKDQHVNLIKYKLVIRNRMFWLNTQNDIIKCLKTCVNDSFCMWCLRLGHVNFKGLKLLNKKTIMRMIVF